MKSILILLLIFAGASAGPLAAAPDGKALYEEHCVACHQYEGRGGIGLPLTKDKMSRVTDDYLTRTIRHGRPGRIMPGFQLLSDAQVKALIRYVRSWTASPRVTFSDATVSGDVENGQALFAAYCTTCHGLDGSGEGFGTGVTMSRERRFMIMPAALNNPGFQASASDEMIKDVITNGRRNSIMPAFGELGLSEKQIDDLVVYVRTLKKPDTETPPDPEDMPAAYVVESPYDFATSLQNVQEAVRGSNFRIFPERFLEQGLTDEFEVNRKQVGIRFCNFKELFALLKVEPRLGTVLPCRITVMEQADGRVVLVAPNMRFIALWFNNDELKAIASTMDGIIQGILEEATL